MKRVLIELVKRGDDCGAIVQYAHSIKSARYLIENVLPATLPGYYYRIVESVHIIK